MKKKLQEMCIFDVDQKVALDFIASIALLKNSPIFARYIFNDKILIIGEKEKI